MTRSTHQMPCPKEDREQQTVVEWARWQEGARPELRNLYAVPNGAKRTRGQGGKQVGLGLRKGVPDLCLAWPAPARLTAEGVVGPFHGLYIEMKRERGGRIEPEQQDWAERLIRAGYAHIFAKGADQAIAAIREYLGMRVER